MHSKGEGKLREALLYASTFIIEEDLMWFVPVRYNYLCCYNLQTEEVVKKYRLPEGNLYPRMYDNILSYEGKLYLIPFNGSNVLVFDKGKEVFERISMAPYDTIKYRFCAATIYQDTLYMFSEQVAAEIENPYIVVRVNLSSKEITQIVELDVEVVSARKPYYEVFARQSFVIERQLYILLQRTNQVLGYDLERNITQVYVVGSSENRYTAMCVDKDKFYFIDQEGDVTVWDKAKNINSKYKNTISGYQVEKKDIFAAFSSSFKYEDMIYFVPRYANKVLAFNSENIIEAPFSEVLQSCKKRFETNWVGKFLSCVQRNHILYLSDGYSYKFHMVNLVTNRYIGREIATIFKKDELDEMYLEALIEKREWYYEDSSEYFNLEFFLKNLRAEKDVKELDKNAPIGKEILQRII